MLGHRESGPQFTNVSWGPLHKHPSLHSSPGSWGLSVHIWSVPVLSIPSPSGSPFTLSAWAPVVLSDPSPSTSSHADASPATASRSPVGLARNPRMSSDLDPPPMVR